VAGLALLAAAAVTGCPRAYPPPPDAYVEAEPLLAAAATGRAALRALVAEARVEYYGADGVRKGKVVIAAARPAQVRFEALSPSGDFLALLVSDGERFVSFERGRDECWVGPACPLNVGRLLPLTLPPEAVVAVLLGEAPLIAHESATVAWDEDTGRYDVVLEAPARGERQTISFGGEDLAARAAKVRRDGALLFEVGFENLRRQGPAPLPTRIRFRMPEGDVDLSIEYRDVETNPENLGDATFRFECPAGTQVWELPCDASPARRVP
jgi:outer membrane lipoprotein-sorting protein